MEDEEHSAAYIYINNKIAFYSFYVWNQSTVWW